MKKNVRYIILGTFILLVLVLIYLISNMILSESSYESISSEIQSEPLQEVPVNPKEPSTQVQGSIERETTEDEPVEVVQYPDKASQKTAVVHEQDKPDYVATDMKKTPEKNSAIPGAKIENVTLHKGQTLWQVASNSGDKNPWRWTDILRLNYEKSRYLIFDTDLDFWFVIMPSGESLKVPDKPTRIKYNRNAPKKFAVQLAAYPTDSKKIAYDLTETLNRDGYFAYVYLTDTKIKSETNPVAQKYYRVRVGFFEAREEGVELAKELIKKYSSMVYDFSSYFIVEPSYKELDGRLFNFGIQLAMPYALELMETKDRNEALTAIRKMKVTKNYPYLLKRGYDSSRYAIRVGFFTTEQEAEKHLDGVQQRNPGTYPSAKVIKLESLMETTPGQNLNLYLPY